MHVLPLGVRLTSNSSFTSLFLSECVFIFFASLNADVTRLDRKVVVSSNNLRTNQNIQIELLLQ